MKRVIEIFLLFFLLMSNCYLNVYADSSNISPTSPKKIIVYSKPDITVEFNGVKQVFHDSKGVVVYPIIYNGSTYLPIRSISSLMREPVEWDSPSKTVFIGKTLSNPSKSLLNLSTSAAITLEKSYINNITPQAMTVSAYLKPDVLVMYDFELQTFEDVNGDNVSPIIYNGTTYLPVRAISRLMEEPIEWDGSKSAIYIGDGEDPKAEETLIEKHEESVATERLRGLFEREEILYYEATAKITNLKAVATLEDKMVIASTVSENYLSAQNLTVEIKAMNTTEFTIKEMETYTKILAFIESTEYYILVLENIAYLASQDTDYSMLAETFLYFALDSQAKMEEARLLVQALNQ